MDVLKDLASKQDGDYISWIGHANLIIKLGENSNSLELLILKDSMEYCSQSFSFTLILPALLYPLFVHLEK